MKILQEIEQLLAKTTRAEKAQVLQWIVRDLPAVEELRRLGQDVLATARVDFPLQGTTYPNELTSLRQQRSP
uniref:Uncharacterized protein n=1 Tax=Caldilinea aerophila TaxID=133453 RepID=A0A7C1FVM3_9CHLR